MPHTVMAVHGYIYHMVVVVGEDADYIVFLFNENCEESDTNNANGLIELFFFDG